MEAGSRILSDQPFRRAYLFGSEEGDRIQIDSSSIALDFQTPGKDIDYIFVEPQADAVLTAEGFSVRDIHNQTISSSFHMAEISKGPSLPAAADFSSPGCVVIRKAGRINQLELTDEQKEELRSVGYVDQ
jgi:hypothetical protein